ncbi:NYN domain-containing protein [Candidatus Saccharibacteria bacterium]|nr:NYN domain-containing protein [Candidatus Saccharibacteria bacterium]MBI3338281.1 NYN domain-containing protein [Candidatus Saccharibacteria bacterium]
MNISDRKIYAFIDSQNLNISTRKLGWKMDWKKFREFLADKYGVTKAFMFIGYVPEFEDMYRQLNEAGYAVVLKPTFDITKPQPETKDVNNPDEDKKPVKGNIDADLVLWAMKELPNYDKAVIISGDGDFYTLVEYLEEKGKLLKLLAPSGHYSNLFNRFEKYIERLDQHRGELTYRNHSRPKSSSPRSK